MAQVHGTSAVHASNPPATQQEPPPPRQQPTATRQQHAEPPQDPARPTARPRGPSRSSRPERGTVYICRWLWRAPADAGCLACAVQRVTGALPPPLPPLPPLSHRRGPSHHQCHPLEYRQYLAPARGTLEREVPSTCVSPHSPPEHSRPCHSMLAPCSSIPIQTSPAGYMPWEVPIYLRCLRPYAIPRGTIPPARCTHIRLRCTYRSRASRQSRAVNKAH